MEPKYIDIDPVLSPEHKDAFEQEYQLTSDAQKDYGQVVLGIMKKKGIDAETASKLTGLNKQLFNNLEKSGGSIQKRFVVSIAIGFGLDVHITEYILESCGMRFCSADRLDKAYIHIIEQCKGKDIEHCNAVLRDLGVDGNDMLGELERGGYKLRKK